MSPAYDPLVRAGLTAADVSAPISPLRREPFEFDAARYAHLQDPCPVFAGGRWHLFGTGDPGGGARHEILHATGDELSGPWRVHDPVVLVGFEGCTDAPAVVAEGNRLHMYIQTSFNVLGGSAEHLTSDDDGATFLRRGVALRARPGTGEAGIYDPHPVEIAGSRYLVYAAFSVIGRPDIFLARSRSGSWDGPWDRLGAILAHPHVSWHNQHDDPAYEWGLEGAQLLELPAGRVLLNATCFLPNAPPRDRQRVFVAVADVPTGPFTILGPVVPGPGDGEVYENGHATAVLDAAGRLQLVFHEWTSAHPGWRLGRASGAVADIADF